ncbi:MAG: RidA family protein [Dehalococcoidia bacterium]
MATKVAVPCETAPDRSAIFNWGLKVSDFKELFLLTGQIDSDPDGNCRHPDDPVGQTQGVFDSLVGMLKQEGWSVNDIIRVEVTVTKDVDLAKHRDGIMKVWADTFEDVNPKPAAGTLRIIHALARPGFVVEFEFMAAR